MKKINFLIKLAKEGTLQIVEPSDEIKNAYIQRSNESISSAKALFNINNLKDSVALTYYSMYHVLLALLFRVGIKCENHTASIMLLKEVFGIDNSKISKAKAERVDKQYYVDFEVNREEAENSIKIAEEFISMMNDLIARLTEEKIKSYRQKAINIIKNDDAMDVKQPK